MSGGCLAPSSCRRTAGVMRLVQIVKPRYLWIEHPEFLTCNAFRLNS
jgi:hypothetical protein